MNIPGSGNMVVLFDRAIFRRSTIILTKPEKKKKKKKQLGERGGGRARKGNIEEKGTTIY